MEKQPPVLRFFVVFVVFVGFGIFGIFVANLRRYHHGPMWIDEGERFASHP
jgi:hypothetical protein